MENHRTMIQVEKKEIRGMNLELEVNFPTQSICEFLKRHVKGLNLQQNFEQTHRAKRTKAA